MTLIGYDQLVRVWQDGLWNIVYYETLLGRFDEHAHIITGAPSLKGKC